MLVSRGMPTRGAARGWVSQLFLGCAGAAQYASDTVDAAKRAAGQAVGGATQTAKDTATGTVNYAADTAAGARVRPHYPSELKKQNRPVYQRC